MLPSTAFIDAFIKTNEFVCVFVCARCNDDGFFVDYTQRKKEKL